MKRIILGVVAALVAIAAYAQNCGCPPPGAPAPLPYTIPAQVNPQSPMAFGALCDGVTDDTAAFQKAVNAGDVLVPNATCVINGTVTIAASNRHFQCQPGGTLLQTNGGVNGQMFYIGNYRGPFSGDSVVNCIFQGSNTVAPQYYNNDNRRLNIAIEATDQVNGLQILGNSFKQFFGQSEVQTYGTTNGGTGDVISYNTFASCGYYGVALVAHTNGTVAHNTFVDCALGVENDNAKQNSGGNVFDSNTLSVVYGYGAPDMNAAAMLTGGATLGPDYSTNVVKNNTISGTSNGQGFRGLVLGTRIIIAHSQGVKSAQYTNNTCGTGCTITP